MTGTSVLRTSPVRAILPGRRGGAWTILAVVHDEKEGEGKREHKHIISNMLGLLKEISYKRYRKHYTVIRLLFYK